MCYDAAYKQIDFTLFVYTFHIRDSFRFEVEPSTWY